MGQKRTIDVKYGPSKKNNCCQVWSL